METRADHQRAATEARAFFSECATEQPAPSMVETLHQSKQDDYAVRHAGKRGRDLFADKPIAGNNNRIGAQKTSSQLSTQRCVARAPSADLPRRQALTKLAVNTLPECISTSSTCWATQVASCSWWDDPLTLMWRTTKRVCLQ